MGDEQMQVNWRIKVGIAIFVASLGWPILIPILSLVGLPPMAVAAFSGVMVMDSHG